MTRTIAIEWQEKRFPAPPEGGSRICLLPTLCETYLDLRASVSGAADPWERSQLLEVKKMLQARIDTWWEHGGRDHFVLVDNLVKQVVEAMIRIADEELKTRNW